MCNKMEGNKDAKVTLRVLPDGRYVFCKADVYITLTKDQVMQMLTLIDDHEKELSGNV